MNIQEVIKGLKEVDLSTYPEQEIRVLLNNIGIMASMSVTFHRGKSLMRARPNENEDVRYSKKADFSFKPQEYNKTYQRASTPYQTMFYATAVPEKLNQGELDNMRVIGVAETIPMLRDKQKSGYKKISFGRWIVHEDLNLLAIIHKDSYYHANSFTRELVEAFNKASQSVPTDLLEKSLTIQTYLADEFSKEEIKGDYDYMISAIFSEIAVKRGYDGIFYPSVRVQGQGFNIAITPEATKKLGLYVAGECSIYKIKDHTIIGNDAIVELDGKQESFEMVQLDGHRKEILAKLGIENLDELKEME